MVLYKICVLDSFLVRILYSIDMKPENMRRLRIASLAVIGTAVTIGIAMTIGLIVLAEPSPVTLADRIDAERTTLFIATDNREEFSNLLDRFQKMFGSSVPELSEISLANRYEVAVIRSGSGSSWTVYAHDNSRRTYAVLTSNTGSSTLPAPSEKKKSLAHMQAFEQNVPTNNVGSVLWLDTGALPLPETPAGSVARAILAPYSGVLSVWQEHGKGILTMVSDERHSVQDAPPSLVSHLPGKTSFLIEAGDPAGTLKRLASNLEHIDRPLKEGLEGVVQERIRSLFGQESLTQAVDSFLAGPASFAIVSGSGGQSFVLSGTAASAEHLQKGLEMMASVGTEAVVRRMRFFDGENSRTDVTVGMGDIEEKATSGVWTLLTIGSGNTTHIAGGRKGRQYVLGNDEALVASVITGIGPARSDMDTFRGSIDTAWARTEVLQALPFLADGLEDTFNLLIGSDVSRVRWRASPAMSGVRVEWETETLANPS